MPQPGGFFASLLPFVGQRKGYVQQNSSVILAQVTEGKEKDLYDALETIGVALRRPNPPSLFYNMPTVHYAAWLILPGVRDKSGIPGPARLLLETNYDGSLDDHLTDLIGKCGPALDNVYRFCEGYPGSGCRDTNAVRDYLYAQHKLTKENPAAYYIALPGRTVADIRNAIAVYEEAKCFLETLPMDSNSNAAHAALVAHFENAPNVPPRRFPITQKGLTRLFVFNLVIVLSLMLPLALLYLIFWLALCLIARWFEEKERREERRRPIPDPTYHPAEYAYLDLGRQNHLCTFATIRPGIFRIFVTRSALCLGRLLFTRFYILGKLDEMTTVHFARWMVIDRQLLFYGNYDGDYSSYLSDFSDQAWGVNLIWGNTIGFPPTRFLSRGGASDLYGFGTQALTHYSPAPVFYSAYGNYSLPNILRYLEFRDELADEIGA
jgi:hypothetical protein